ncbi:MAG: hypothetical protein KFB93_01510 [Simkaniaceae bacterium]|nr:MAG: hypothetical protein KFB93_01510 [Simkaniaceae bacterium]
MQKKLFKILLPFFIIPLYCNESFFEQGRIGDAFYQPPREEKKTLKIRGEFLFLGENVGYAPAKCDFSPGYRITLVAPSFLNTLEVEVQYTHWESATENTFRIPVMQITRTIENDYNFNAAHLNLVRSFILSKTFSIKPMIGVQWENYERRISLKNHWATLSQTDSTGPLTGLDFHANLHPNITISTHLSLSYLYSQNKKWMNHKLAPNNPSFFHPKSQLDLKVEFRLPSPALTLKGGYEIQYKWMENIHHQIDWKNPSNIQGFTGELTFAF